MSKTFKIKLIFYIIISVFISNLLLNKIEIIKFTSYHSVHYNMIIYIIISFFNSCFICLSYKHEKNNTSK